LRHAGYSAMIRKIQGDTVLVAPNMIRVFSVLTKTLTYNPKMAFVRPY